MSNFEGQNILNFIKELPNDEACHAYLAKIKWKDGFICAKCGATKGCELKGYRYHCYGCRHVESATANTLFHKVKFGLQKAFCIVFEMSVTSKSLSSIQIGKRFEIRQATAWYFMHKVREAMKSSQKYPMEELVHVDEFTVGGMEKDKPGRSYNVKKKKAVIAVELTNMRRVKRVYVKAIDDYSSKSLTPIFEEHISQSAEVVTDKWRGYQPIGKKWDLVQIASNNGKNFKELHIIIHQVKTWLRTIQTHVGKNYIQAYFNEYCYRINRSQSKKSIFHRTIEKMVEGKPLFHKSILQNVNV